MDGVLSCSMLCCVWNSMYVFLICWKLCLRLVVKMWVFVVMVIFGLCWMNSFWLK